MLEVSANFHHMTTGAVRLSRQERERAIIEAAMREFAVGGLYGTAVEAVAKRVGVSQPYLFRLFGTKKELFVAALRGGFGRTLRAFMDAAAEVPEDADAEAVLKALGAAYRRLLEDRTLLLLQMQGYAACDDLEIRAVVREEFARLYRFVSRSSGAPAEALRSFFAEGMLMNVAAAMDLPDLKEEWARICCGDD
jgi:AcrR family transcriptional regulator